MPVDVGFLPPALVAPGRFGLTACPGRFPRHARALLPSGDPIGHACDALVEERIDGLVCLLGDDELRHLDVPTLPAEAANRGLAFLRYPIVDFAVPGDLAAFSTLVARVDEALAAAESYVVFCRAGRGRSGTFAASLLCHRGLRPGEAIATVREARPGAVENARQEDFVARYANWKG